MRLITFYYMLFSLFIPSCFHNHEGDDPPRERTIQNLRVASKISKLARKKYRLKMSGEGCQSQLDVDKTRGVSYSFHAKGLIASDTARELLVKMTLEVLKVLNEDIKFRKFMYEHPFSIKNLKVSIFTAYMSKGSRNLQVYPNISSASMWRKHLSFDFYTKDQDLEKLTDLEYLKGYKTSEETFRLGIHKVQHTLSPELLEVANQLDLLNGNLEDDYIDCSAEKNIEDNKIENQISRYKAMHKDGNITEVRMKQFIEEAVCELKDISREEKIEKFRELYRTDIISEKRMRKLIELEENTEPYIQDD